MATYSDNMTGSHLDVNTSDVSSASGVPLIALGYGSLILMIVLGNGLILVTIFCCGKLRVAGLPYIASLSVADLLLGALGVPLQMYTMITQGPTEFYSCLVFFLASVVFSQVSVLCLVAVTWDRFVAVVFPLKHKTIMTTRKIYTLISISWILGIIIGTLPITAWHMPVVEIKTCYIFTVISYNYFSFVTLFAILLPILFVIAINIWMYLSVKNSVSATQVFIDNYGRCRCCSCCCCLYW